MNKLTKFSLRNTVVVFLIIVMIIGGGIYSTSSIKQEAMPNISIPVITASTLYIGAAPEDVAEKISRPLQKAISGIQGITEVQTISNENISFVIANFGYSEDMDKAQRAVEDAVGKVVLPDAAQKTVISKISFGSFPVMQYSIESTLGQSELTKYVDEKLQPKLTGVSGVSNVDIQGTGSKQIYIKLDSDKLTKYNINASDIQKTLQANNVNIPAGSISIGNTAMTVKISSSIRDINELKATPFVVMPNQSAAIGESMGKVMAGVGQLGQAVAGLGQAVSNLGQGMGQMGTVIGQNTQAIAMLNIIQQSEAMILQQQSILADPNAGAIDKAKASAMIKQGQAMLQGAQKALAKVINTIMTNQKGGAKASPVQGVPGYDVKGSQMTQTGGGTGKTAKSTTTSASGAKISTVFLKDIAKVYMADNQSAFYTRADGKPGMMLNIYKNDDANTVAVAGNVKNALSELAKDTNGKVKFNQINDSSDTIKTSVNGMVKEGLLGALFAVLVIALFLRDLRATIIAVISIPLSILIALILLPRFNITLNIMSLGGMAVAVGRIVDDSIVVIENIHRRIEQRGNQGMSREELVESAAREVSSAITSSTITTVAVFLPLAMVSGMVGKIFTPFALTVVICILASLLVAVTVVPTLCRLTLFKEKKKPKAQKKDSRIIKGYHSILGIALRHKVAVILISVALLAISFGMVSKVGVQFMPSDTTALMTGKLSLPPGTDLQKTNEESTKFEKFLSEDKDVKTVVSSVGDTSGTTGLRMSLQGSNAANYTIVLKDGIHYDDAAQRIIEETKKFNGDGESLIVKTQSTTGSRDNFEIVVNGDNYNSIEKAAAMITKRLEGIKELSNLANNLSEKKKEISVAVDKNKAASKGLSPMVVVGIVRGMMSDSTIMTLSNNGKDVAVNLGFDGKSIDTIDKLKNLQMNLMGTVMRLKDVANISVQYGPVSISEQDGNQYASITADLAGSDTSKISKVAMKKIDEIKEQLPAGISYSLGGSSKQIADTFGQMGVAMLAAILMVYIVMVLAFGEATAPFAILFSLPFAAVGAIFALFITRQPLTVSGLIGMLMLIGIVVTNAIVLLDRVQTNRKNGMGIEESLMEAGSIRLRPIFMTAIATVMALMPLALGFSEGTIISQGLGIVVIGGLTVSTILTLVIVPVMYAALQRIKEKVTLKA